MNFKLNDIQNLQQKFERPEIRQHKKDQMQNGSLKHKFNFSHRRMKSSIEAFDRAAAARKISQRDQNYEHILEKARMFYDKQMYVDTVMQLQQYLQHKCNQNQALYLCGVSYLHLDSPHEAIHKLQLISNQFANKQQSMLLLAMAYAKIQNQQRSLHVINQCLQKYNKFQEGLCYRGKLYLKFQHYQLAQKDFFYSLKLNRRSFISRVGLGDCYYQQHKYDLALKYYEESLQFIDAKFNSSIADIHLKKGICYFQLQRWGEAILSLEKLKSKDLSSEAHYYLGVSYLNLGRKPQAILNLQYSIKLQAKDSKILIQKSFKILIQIYLTDFQFYDAVNTLKLIDSLKIEISCQHWKNFVEGCMLIIKSYYQDGLTKLNEVYDAIKKKKPASIRQSKKLEIEENEFLTQSTKQAKEKSVKRIVYNSKGRKSFSLKHVRKPSFNEQTRTRSIVKHTDQKPFAKLNLKIPQSKSKTLFKAIKKSHLKNPVQQTFTQDESIFIMPILLKFKGYGQFFISNYLRSLDTYEEYQSYMKNVFGKENNELVYNRIICEAFLLNQTDLQKQSLEKLDLAIEEYQKYHSCIPVEPLLYKICTYLKLSLGYFFHLQQQAQSGYEYFQKVLDINTLHSQQLSNHHLSHYYLSIMYYLCEKYEDSQMELEKTLKIVEQCSWKFLYLKGIIEIKLNNSYEAIKEFTAGLILDQSPDLYLGRSIGFLLEGNKRKEQEQKFKYNAKKKSVNNKQQFTLFNDQIETKRQQINHEIFVENSFEDLQKFIELQSDQDKISLWVSKLLFFNQAFEEASRALEKIDNKCPELLEIEFWLKFYDGQFDECGQIGNLMIEAFEGKIFSSEDQDQRILSGNMEEIVQILKFSRLEPTYQKWVLILYLFKKQKYSLLIKLLQKYIFETKQFEQEVELKYNLGIIFLIQGQKNKALSTFQNLLSDVLGHEKMKTKVEKIMKWKFEQDECLSDLSEQFGVNGNHRMSEFLSYKPVEINEKKLKRIYLKLSVPFPSFPKPNIEIKVSKQFFEGELQMDVIDKKIQAPWIKKNKEKVQFTQEIMEAFTDFLKDTKDMANVSQQNLIQQIGDDE